MVFWPNKKHSINFLVKFINFDPLLSPCAWLVKWHKCISVIYIIMAITEKFYLFCNFRASCRITAPAVLRLFWTVCKLNIWLNCDIDIDCWLLCYRINYYYEHYLKLSFYLCLRWLWTWTWYWHPMWGHCYRQDSKNSSYSKPTIKSAKSTKSHKTAGGSVQTQIHEHFEGESVQEEGSPHSRNCEKAGWPSTTIYYHSGDCNCDIRSNKLPGICEHLQCPQAVWTVNSEKSENCQRKMWK